MKKNVPFLLQSPCSLKAVVSCNNSLAGIVPASCHQTFSVSKSKDKKVRGKSQNYKGVLDNKDGIGMDKKTLNIGNSIPWKMHSSVFNCILLSSCG